MSTSVAEITRVSMQDAVALSTTMRHEDALECHSMAAMAPLEGILYAIDVSICCWSIKVRGEVIAIFGLAHPGVPWLLTSDSAKRHARKLHQAALDVLPKFLERYPVLTQYVDARYLSAVRWLRRLGFEIHEAEPFGPFGLPFHRVELRRASCASQCSRQLGSD